MEWLKGIGATIVIVLGSLPLIRKAYKENKDVYEKVVPLAEKIKLYLADKKLDEKERKDLVPDLLSLATEIEEASIATKKLWNKFKVIKSDIKK